MNLSNIKLGKNYPEDFNVVIEIPANSGPVKYEFNKECGMVEVDRFMPTSMNYPCNYGFVPNTMGEDGDPLDVLVYTRVPLYPGVLINCRAIGVLIMEDESGMDEKVLAVPNAKIEPWLVDIKTCDDLPPLLIKQIQHFFESYKALEPGKWVKVKGWENAEQAKAIMKRAAGE